jgi:phosphate transport system substrate-binding protein
MPIQATKVRLLLSATLAVLLVSSAGCARSASYRELSVNGSTTIEPIAEISGEMFEASHLDTRVLVSGVGSSAGIESVSNKTSDIGTSSRDLNPSEKGLGLVDTPMAYDAIAVIVNPGNTVRGLTTAQVKAIFEGKITNWSEVGGADMTIGLVNRDEASGTREAFGKIVLGGASFDPRAAVLPGTGQVRSVVAGTKGAVGYISSGFVTADVRAISIDGVEPSMSTVLSGSYPVRRVLHFFPKGQPTGLAKEYIDYVLSDAVQKSVIADAGFTPVSKAGK